jgi:replicative DNA helicase
MDKKPKPLAAAFIFLNDNNYPPKMPENLNYDRAVESLKVPPNSIQAEQSVLGGLMIDNQTWDAIADKVGEEDFYRKDHRLIFRTIDQLAEKQIPFDVVTISEALAAIGELDTVGGLAYLGTLAKDTPSAANIVSYANIVRERSVLRQLIHVGTEISDSAFNTEGRETAELLEIAEREVFKIAEQRQKGLSGFQPIKTLLAKAIDKIEIMFAQEGSITGASTGFTELDRLTSGLQTSDLIIVAGRPSMGKTTIAMNIAENVAIKGGKPVAVFSMEMPGDSLAMRMMSSLGRIDQHKIRTGKLEDDDWPRLTSAMSLLAETKLFIDDTPALTPTEVRSRARRLSREHGQLGLIVLDYLQLMQSPGSGDNRVQQISDISRALKALAKELEVPVIALSQLNRNLEQRPNKRPVMSDLRESGAIEQDADLIIFVYRDEVYHEDSPDKGVAEIIIGKQRNGPLGIVRLTFLGQYTRFENHAANSYDGYE